MKSALLRPDDQPREDTDQAINVRPYNSDQNTGTEHDSEDDYDTDHSDFSEHNDNDNDYGDDDYDDEDDRYDHDEQAGDWTNQFKRVWKLRKQTVISFLNSNL